MSCVLDILSLEELRTRKEHLLKQLNIVEEKILKKEKEEEELYQNEEPKKVVIKNIIKVIKNNVEEKINLENCKNKIVKITLKNKNKSS